jgi:hypothetical protein
VFAWLVGATALLIMLIASMEPVATAAGPKPKSFASPQEAAKSLFEAAKAKDQNAILEILGPAYGDWILSGDAAQDAQREERFVAAYEQKSSIAEGEGKAVLVIGNDDFPFPFPIVKKRDG